MKPNILIIITFFLLFSGCISRKAIVSKYYTIEIPSEQLLVPIDSNSIINGSCKIDQVTINPVYDKNQIVNRASSHEISYYAYHQWAIRPSESVINLIQEHLESCGIFAKVSARYSNSIPDYRFGTSVNRLEVIEIKNSFSAHLNLEFRIIDNSNDQVILSHKADRTSVLKQKDLNLFAREVSSIINEELKVFTMILEDNLHLFTKGDQ